MPNRYVTLKRRGPAPSAHRAGEHSTEGQLEQQADPQDERQRMGGEWAGDRSLHPAGYAVRPSELRDRGAYQIGVTTKILDTTATYDE